MNTVMKHLTILYEFPESDDPQRIRRIGKIYYRQKILRLLQKRWNILTADE